jgi:hypothetical protein
VRLLTFSFGMPCVMWLLLCSVLALGACEESVEQSYISDLSAITRDMTPLQKGGCGYVDFCIRFLGNGGFSQCVLPFPAYVDTTHAVPYFECARDAGYYGSCKSACYWFQDGGPRDCRSCIDVACAAEILDCKNE